MPNKPIVHNRKKRATHRRKKVAAEKLAPKDWQTLPVIENEPMGLGPAAAGQSGDIEGLPEVAIGDSESVAELVEEGQDLEAEVVSGVENAPDPDEAEAWAEGG